jgi:hypothetical protein
MRDDIRDDLRGRPSTNPAFAGGGPFSFGLIIARTGAYFEERQQSAKIRMTSTLRGQREAYAPLS